MGLALGATGYWMNIDVPATPNAVVICVIIFNAAFGYSWGPLPWLYPPEVGPREPSHPSRLMNLFSRLCLLLIVQKASRYPPQQ